MVLEMSRIDIALRYLDYLTFGDTIINCSTKFLEKANELFPGFQEIKTYGVYDIDLEDQRTSKDISNIIEEYTTLLGFKRIGKKIANGNYYLDSELSIPVAALNQDEDTLNISDFNGKRDIYIMSNKKQVIGYKHDFKDNLVLEPVSKKVYDLDSSSIIYEF